MFLQVARPERCGWPVDRARGQLGLPVQQPPPSTGRLQRGRGYPQAKGCYPHVVLHGYTGLFM